MRAARDILTQIVAVARGANERAQMEIWLAIQVQIFILVQKQTDWGFYNRTTGAIWGPVKRQVIGSVGGEVRSLMHERFGAEIPIWCKSPHPPTI